MAAAHVLRLPPRGSHDAHVRAGAARASPNDLDDCVGDTEPALCGLGGELRRSVVPRSSRSSVITFGRRVADRKNCDRLIAGIDFSGRQPTFVSMASIGSRSCAVPLDKSVLRTVDLCGSPRTKSTYETEPALGTAPAFMTPIRITVPGRPRTSEGSETKRDVNSAPSIETILSPTLKALDFAAALFLFTCKMI